MPTIPSCRCWNPAWVGRARRGSGRMSRRPGLWLHRCPPAVLYCYSPDRQGEHPQEHLRGFTGILQADAYAGYGELYRAGR